MFPAQTLLTTPLAQSGDDGGRATLRETSYLLIGGAIALSFIALTAAISSTFVTRDDPIFTLLLLALVPMAVVGLLPGVRELQVAGVETLLGVDRAVVPEPMSWPHRWRTCLWTFLHQVVGFIAGSALLLAMALVVGAIVLAMGSQPSILDTVITRPDSVGTWILFWAGVIGCVGVAVGVLLLGGAAATWAAPVLLGPTGADRLALAETKLQREQEYRRLSRDLHDGVGHALSAISLQAESGRRHLRHDPDRAGAALAAISDLSGSAVAELDHALSVLRDGAAPRHPEPGLAQLDALLDSHRSLGMAMSRKPRPTGAVYAGVARQNVWQG